MSLSFSFHSFNSPLLNPTGFPPIATFYWTPLIYFLMKNLQLYLSCFLNITQFPIHFHRLYFHFGFSTQVEEWLPSDQRIDGSIPDSCSKLVDVALGNILKIVDDTTSVCMCVYKCSYRDYPFSLRGSIKYLQHILMCCTHDSLLCMHN